MGTESLLVASQLSAISYPSQAETIPIQTARRDTPLPSADAPSDLPLEHASYSTVAHSENVGHILLRVIQGGRTIELASLSRDISPVRFLFPAVLLPHPGIFLYEGDEIHILAVTEHGSLYRLVLPIDLQKVWKTRFGKNWCREYQINYTNGTADGLVQAQGPLCVALGFQDGVLLRLDADIVGNTHEGDQWSENVFSQSSFLSTLTSFLHHPSTSESGFVAMASYPQPTDVGHIVTLSRDRTVRLWTERSGCVAARALPVTATARAVTPAPAHAVATSQKAHVLLEGEAQNLIRLFVQDHESFAMVFIPTPSSTTSGGFFHLFSTRDDQLVSVASLECHLRTVHCHLQDFSIVGGTLYALWDTQGRASVERIKLALTSSNRRTRVMTAESAIWDTAAYAAEPELTPAYLDQLLLQPGSLTGTLMTAILKPGSFSPLTLRLALEQYTNALLSLPGDIPLALRTSYATVAENIAAVVGCRVVLSRNPQTGAAEHDKYWQALRRDWEGFIARCRELERSARWPVGIAVVDQFQPSTAVTARSQNGTASSSPDVFLEDRMFRDILVIERERVGVVALEDLALQLHRILTESSAVPQPFALMDGVWKLRSQLGPTIMTDIESRLIDLSRQEIAFPLPDIIEHQVQQVRFHETLDEGFTAWFQGRMDNIDLTGANIRIALDLIGGFEQAVVKMEIRTESQSEAGAESHPPEWQRALAVSYCTATVEARYELAVSLVILLFFYAQDLTTWDPNLIAEIFAVFRGLAMLRYIVRQPAAAAGSSTSDRLNTDDIAARMRDMTFSRQTDETTGHAYSLLHQLMAQHGGLARTSSIHTAHRYLNETGILQSSSPAQATRPEAVFCKTLWEQGYLQVARELLTWLPRTPAVTYVLGLLWIDMGRADDAGPLLERLGGMFDDVGALSLEDKDALKAVLPHGHLFPSDFDYYTDLKRIFGKASEVHWAVYFTQAALATEFDPNCDTRALWSELIRGNIDLGQYEDAYSAIMSAPYEDMRSQTIIDLLLNRMCDENVIEKLMSFNFVGIADKVEEALAWKARHLDPRERPFWSLILYSWYVSRDDYRNAALVMYQRAAKLADVVAPAEELLQLADMQREAYVTALNAMSLLEKKNAWIVVPVTNDNSRKRRKLNKYIPEDKYPPRTLDAEYVEATDIERDLVFLTAKLDLVRKNPDLLATGGAILTAETIVSRLAHSGRFRTAMSTATSLEVDMSDLFLSLTEQCLLLSREPSAVPQNELTDWLLTDRVSSWPGTTAERGWRYLRQSLERHDSVKTGYRYSQTVLETLLSYDRSSSPPPWLVSALQDHNPESLIRAYFRYDVWEATLEHSVTFVRKTESQLARDPPQTASATWLPYTLLDQVLAVTREQSDLSARARTLQGDLETEISNHVRRMQKLGRLGA